MFCIAQAVAGIAISVAIICLLAVASIWLEALLNDKGDE